MSGIKVGKELETDELGKENKPPVWGFYGIMVWNNPFEAFGWSKRLVGGLSDGSVGENNPFNGFGGLGGSIGENKEDGFGAGGFGAEPELTGRRRELTEVLNGGPPKRDDLG